MNQGTFKADLMRTFRQLKESRAESVSEDVEIVYKREIEDLCHKIRNYDRDRENLILDLSPINAGQGNVVPSDFDAKKFMEKDIVEAHRIYAREIIKMYHGEEFILDAENRYNAISNGLIPDNIDVVNISKENPKINITDLLVSLNFVNSKSEAKRMISQRAVKINDNVITDINYVLDLKNEIILKYGKNKVIKII